MDIANTPLFSILDEDTKKKSAFRQYKNYTIEQFIARIDEMANRGATVNRPLMEVYDTCKYHIDPKSFEKPIPTVKQPTIVDKQPTILTLPNCDNSQPIIKRLAHAIEMAIKCLKEYGLKSVKKKAEKYEMYFLKGLTTKEIQELQGLKSEEAVREQIQNRFVTPLMSGKVFENGIPQFKMSSDFISEIENIAQDSLFAHPTTLPKAIGYEGISPIQNSIYMPFFGLDVLEIDEIRFCCFVPKNEIGTYRDALKAVKDTLYNSFEAIPEQDLLGLIKNRVSKKVNEEQLTKLLENYINALGETERFQDGKIWIKDEFLKTKYLRQARIIYKEGEALTKEAIEKKYQDIYHEDMGVIMSSKLAKMGFACKGIKWIYGKNTLEDVRDVISKCVESHNYVATMQDIEIAVSNAGHKYPESTLRTYITNICVPCNTDKNLFCHKEHVEEHPEYSWRKESTYGQENFAIRQIVNRLSKKTSEPIAELKAWLTSIMQSKNYNTHTVDNTIQKYSSETCHLLIVGNDGQVSLNNIEAEKIDLKTIGYKGASKKYAMAIISLAINELHKQKSNEMWLTDLVPLVLTSIAPEPTLTRKKILDILESEWTEDLSIFRKDERIGIRLNQGFVAAPNYAIDANKANENDFPQMIKVQEEREKISSIATIDWDKMLSRMKRELEFYIKPSWFGISFDLDKALHDFKMLMTTSHNKNLSTTIPHDLYAYWFCATDEYDRNRYFSDLARCYEALLREIYNSVRTIPMKKVNGLHELSMLYFPKIYEALNSPETSYGFRRILKDLNHKRNILAHGDYVELSSVLEAQTITNYIALYVFTIATEGRI